ncbi:hypothetical protein MAR_038546 [Mya arenaria]|uniref:Uncharacterized protein n=1 Tax=Mya arenaria TaxID=6604 RepID=A0ABY7FRU6_MYAAR|nr:hypothetical protein MAR_038546 [Mya arenaria]
MQCPLIYEVTLSILLLCSMLIAVGITNDISRITFLWSDSDHLQFTEQWFIDNIVDKFLT